MSIGDDPVVVDDAKKSKKRKDKGVKLDAEQEQQTTEVAPPEKVEKRKREENGKGEERKRKKKRKDTADVSSVEEPTPAVVEENTAKEHAALGIDKEATRRKRKELRKELKKQQKALAKGKARAASSSRVSAASKPTPPIKHTINTEEAEKYLSENAITIHGDVVPVLDFDQLDIQPPLREVLNIFSKPTPIQACAWPALLEGKDVIGIAETGRFVPKPIFQPLILKVSQWQNSRVRPSDPLPR
jgi:ATP-dependent RNA helicase DBP3